ncbi:hypothetical protein D3C78_1742530 [compost metagenome]
MWLSSSGATVQANSVSYRFTGVSIDDGKISCSYEGGSGKVLKLQMETAGIAAPANKNNWKGSLCESDKITRCAFVLPVENSGS